MKKALNQKMIESYFANRDSWGNREFNYGDFLLKYSYREYIRYDEIVKVVYQISAESQVDGKLHPILQENSYAIYLIETFTNIDMKPFIVVGDDGKSHYTNDFYEFVFNTGLLLDVEEAIGVEITSKIKELILRTTSINKDEEQSLYRRIVKFFENTEELFTDKEFAHSLDEVFKKITTNDALAKTLGVSDVMNNG